MSKSFLYKLGISWENDNDVTICEITLSSIFPINFSYWSKFHVNIMIGLGAMTIFIYKGLTRNPEIENTPA